MQLSSQQRFTDIRWREEEGEEEEEEEEEEGGGEEGGGEEGEEEEGRTCTSHGRAAPAAADRRVGSCAGRGWLRGGRSARLHG